jgi:HD-like signal output (HDOD) protein
MTMVPEPGMSLAGPASTDYPGVNVISYTTVNLVRVAQSFGAAPRIMARLGLLLRDPNVALKDVAACLKQDSTLAARVLRIANSAAFAQSEPVAATEDAAALIGLKEIHRFVGAVAIDQFSLRHYPLFGFTGPRLRDNAILVALLMEELAPHAKEDPSTAYAAGLFRSIGKLALAKIADEHAPLVPFNPSEILPLMGWEKHTFGLTSNQATAAILKEWNFPRPVVQAIDGHYAPAASSHPLTGLLNLAAHLADKREHGLPGESSYWLEPTRSAGLVGLNPRYVERASERALTAFDRINRALG